MSKLNIHQISDKLGRYIVKIGNTFTVKGEFLGFAEMAIFIDDLERLILENYKIDKFSITYKMLGYKSVTKQFKRYQEAHEAPSLTVQDIPNARHTQENEQY